MLFLKISSVKFEDGFSCCNIFQESEESEKLDEDSKIIEELRESNEYQRAQIAHLEKALKLAMANQEEVKMMNNNEIQKSKEIIDDLNKKLEIGRASCRERVCT